MVRSLATIQAWARRSRAARWAVPSLSTRFVAAAAFCALIGSCHSQPLVREAAVPLRARCYTIAYDPDEMGVGFPGQIALGTGSDSGAAYWIPEARDTLGIWQMFQGGAYWQRGHRDSLTIAFSNGFSGVEITALPKDSVIVGRAVWHSDVVDTLPPPSALLRGRLVDCAALLAQ